MRPAECSRGKEADMWLILLVLLFGGGGVVLWILGKLLGII
jgi:hypothetical protein